MLQIWFAAFLIFVSGTKAMNMSFRQSDFVLMYERVELVSYNPQFLSDVVVKNYKLNRTQAATNATFTLKKNFSDKFKIQFQAYKFMSNEYRHFPVRFSYDFCEALRRNDFGFGNSLKCGNLSRAGCPLKKGTYHLCNFFIDGAKFPPHVPEGSYMGDVKWFDGLTELVFVQGYGTIKYKNFWQH